ncbi:hypothetical protein CHCC15075_2485 [Bacillus licheniformis]|nr:hypothetical protein CHCC15075_2485 [Bacillus licheniformis]TWM52118.1 hypothetical protein CHCC14815_2946 [Bacillus licheniformis]
MPSLAEAAADVKRLMDNNPKPMSVAEIEAVYLKLLDIRLPGSVHVFHHEPVRGSQTKGEFGWMS